MQDLHKTKNNSWALFMGHLVIEKLAKALFVKRNGDYPPLIHDLRRLLEMSGEQLVTDKIVILDTITRFNIRVRYDDYKNNFYKLCTESFTEEWVNHIKECRKWIKSML
ncbi:MAG: HEPN domain-containing protein [Bacteroidales bacterium]